MPDEALVVEGKPLSQGERVIDTFVAPSKTFTDILRSASWWLPYLLLVLSTWVLAFALQQKVGWSQLADNEVRLNPKAQAKMADLSPEQVAMQHRFTQGIMQGTMFGAPVTNLFFLAVFAIVLWPTMNFVFGGSATFGRTMAVCAYAALPGIFKSLLAAVLLYAGRSPDTFTMETMLGSNPGYYLSEPGPLKSILESFDVFTLWTMVLLSIGMAIAARTKRNAGYYAVFGWFALILLIRTAAAVL